jgi:hypothetical protein
VFEEASRFGEAFAFEGESGLIFFEGTVDSSGTYSQEFCFDGGGNTEGRPLGDSVHLLPHKRGQEFPAFIPEERPDEAEGSDDLIGVDFFTGTVGGSFFRRLEFDRLASVSTGPARCQRLIENTQGIFSVLITGNLDEFVQNGRLFFPSGL